MARTNRISAILLSLMTGFVLSSAHAADDAPSADEAYGLHAQFTNVWQYHPSFDSPYRGQNSLDPGNRGNETISATLFAGIRPWDGAEFWVDPEIDQGFGLSNTLGLAGFSSGEAYKIGAADPYVRMQRAFFRQNFDLGGAVESVESGANQLGGSRTANRVTVTLGKFSVGDVFDANQYAHDPRADFMNWTVIDGGAFDYPADAWGYAYGAAADWQQDWWSLRAGLFDLSREPNSKRMTRGFGQYSEIVEGEERHEIGGEPGKLKLTLFANHANMGSYSDAVALAATTGGPASTALVRQYHVRAGAMIGLEQQIAPDLGLFARASLNDGHLETYEFTDANRSVSTGLSIGGNHWGRADDEIGLAGVINGLSDAARRYFAAGGLGPLIGDGQLLHYGLEKIAETYYSLSVTKGIAVTLDYQFVTNPAYNEDRGPVHIFGLRLHAEI